MLTLAAVLVACRESPEERIAALVVLDRNADAGTAGRVRGFLADADPDVRALALVTLARHDPGGAGAASLEALGDPAPEVRAAAARIAAEARPAGGSRALAALLRNDPVAEVRQRAAEALAAFGDDQAREALTAALVDAEPAVRRAAARSLDAAGSAASLRNLGHLLLLDDAWEVRVEAIHALERARVPGAWTAIRPALDDPNEFVRVEAARAIQALRAAGMEPEGSSDPADAGSTPESVPPDSEG